MSVTLHELKIYPKYLKAIREQEKRFELRANDRNFKTGDFVILREFDNIKYTGDYIKCQITYVLDYNDGKVFGLQPDYCVFGFKLI